MQRVTRSTAVTTLPAVPSSPGAPGYFGGGNPGSGAPATVPGYEWFNGVQEELINLILAGNQVPSAANNTQLVAALANLFPGMMNGSYRSLGTTGFMVLPAGLTLQWGTYSGSPTSYDGFGYEKTNIAVTFPIAFNTQCFVVQATAIDIASVPGYEGAWVSGLYAGGFTGCVRGKNSGTTITAMFLAVGA
jgi:hypothetical protein